jgi:hypothetical protein
MAHPTHLTSGGRSCAEPRFFTGLSCDEREAGHIFQTGLTGLNRMRFLRRIIILKIMLILSNIFFPESV